MRDGRWAIAVEMVAMEQACCERPSMAARAAGVQEKGVGDDSRLFARVRRIAMGALTYLDSGVTFSEPPARRESTTREQQQRKQKRF